MRWEVRIKSICIPKSFGCQMKSTFVIVLWATLVAFFFQYRLSLKELLTDQLGLFRLEFLAFSQKWMKWAVTTTDQCLLPKMKFLLSCVIKIWKTCACHYEHENSWYPWLPEKAVKWPSPFQFACVKGWAFYTYFSQNSSSPRTACRRNWESSCPLLSRASKRCAKNGKQGYSCC